MRVTCKGNLKKNFFFFKNTQYLQKYLYYFHEWNWVACHTHLLRHYSSEIDHVATQVYSSSRGKINGYNPNLWVNSWKNNFKVQLLFGVTFFRVHRKCALWKKMTLKIALCQVKIIRNHYSMGREWGRGRKEGKGHQNRGSGTTLFILNGIECMFGPNGQDNLRNGISWSQM